MTAPFLVVVGAGIAGCAAALEAARLGIATTLIDEHPQSPAELGLDAPYFYGSRLPATLSTTMAEQVLSANEALIECLEAGVEVRTGTCVWGAFVPGENSRSLDGSQLGLAESGRSEMLRFDHVIFATGARDLVLSFPKWELPGVLGANGAAALIARYQGFTGRRMIVLGSGNLGLELATLALASGIEVAAVVEVGLRVRGDAALAARLESAGVSMLLGHTIECAVGENEVRAARLVAVDAAMRTVPNSAREVACDTIVEAFGTVPNIELPALAGCSIVHEAARGGWVPSLHGGTRTSLPFIHVAGDVAGVGEESYRDPMVAGAQGRLAARSVAAAIGLASDARVDDTVSISVGSDETAATDWLRSLLAAGGLDVTVCQCEEVTRRELLEVQPPRYLGAGPVKTGGLDGLSPRARTRQDLIKRLTRVGMGLCQGKRCRDQSLMLIARAAACRIDETTPGTYRAPVRPLALKTLWPHDESEELRQHWPFWLHPSREEQGPT